MSRETYSGVFDPREYKKVTIVICISGVNYKKCLKYQFSGTPNRELKKNLFFGNKSWIAAIKATINRLFDFGCKLNDLFVEYKRCLRLI